MSWNKRISLLAPETMSRRTFLAGLGAVLGGSARSRVVGEQIQENDAKPEGSKERLEGMRRLAQKVKFFVLTDGTNRRPVALRPEPLDRYGNRAMGILDGTLWAWGEKGRPLATLKVELWPDRDEGRGRWSFGISSSATAPIAVEFFDGFSWSSTAPGVEFHNVPDAPRPAEAAGTRLAQAKAISRGCRRTANTPAYPADSSSGCSPHRSIATMTLKPASATD